MFFRGKAKWESFQDFCASVSVDTCSVQLVKGGIRRTQTGGGERASEGGGGGVRDVLSWDMAGERTDGPGFDKFGVKYKYCAAV